MIKHSATFDSYLIQFNFPLNTFYFNQIWNRSYHVSTVFHWILPNFKQSFALPWKKRWSQANKDYSEISWEEKKMLPRMIRNILVNFITAFALILISNMRHKKEKNNNNVNHSQWLCSIHKSQRLNRCDSVAWDDTVELSLCFDSDSCYLDTPHWNWQVKKSNQSENLHSFDLTRQ